MATATIVRNCPRCGSYPATIYPPKTYVRMGRPRTVIQSYCSTCQKTYAQQTRKPRTQDPLPTPRARITDATLAEVLAAPDAWRNCFTNRPRWIHLRELILKRDNYQCTIQGERCTGTATQADHIVRRSEGGDDHPDNLRAACAQCNNARESQPVPCCADCGSVNVVWIRP